MNEWMNELLTITIVPSPDVSGSSLIILPLHVQYLVDLERSCRKAREDAYEKTWGTWKGRKGKTMGDGARAWAWMGKRQRTGKGTKEVENSNFTYCTKGFELPPWRWNKFVSFSGPDREVETDTGTLDIKCLRLRYLLKLKHIIDYKRHTQPSQTSVVLSVSSSIHSGASIKESVKTLDFKNNFVSSHCNKKKNSLPCFASF